MKYEAWTIVPPHVAKTITADRIIDSRAIWTNGGKHLGDDFQPEVSLGRQGL